MCAQLSHKKGGRSDFAIHFKLLATICVFVSRGSQTMHEMFIILSVHQVMPTATKWIDSCHQSIFPKEDLQRKQCGCPQQPKADAGPALHHAEQTNTPAQPNSTSTMLSCGSNTRPPRLAGACSPRLAGASLPRLAGASLPRLAGAHLLHLAGAHLLHLAGAHLPCLAGACLQRQLLSAAVTQLGHAYCT